MRKIIKKYAVGMGYLTGQTHSGKLLYSNYISVNMNAELQASELRLIQSVGLTNLICRRLAERNNIKQLDMFILLLIAGFAKPTPASQIVKSKVRSYANSYHSIWSLESAGLIERKKRIKTEATKIHITEAGVKVVRSYLVALARLRRQHYNI
jgi:DNA-binding MarR family transcriptional regulator